MYLACNQVLNSFHNNNNNNNDELVRWRTKDPLKIAISKDHKSE